MATQPTAQSTRRPRREVFVVLPAYNESACLARLLEEIDASMDDSGMRYRVIVVDDGSTDDTAAIAKRLSDSLPVTLEQHPQNLGLGATIRDGLARAAADATPRDIIVTMDADETHTPGLILRMTREILEGHDVVIASRYQPGSRTIGVPLYRRALSYGGSMVFRILFPTRGVKDFTCGYRAYRAGVIQDALEQYGDDFLNQDGFQCMVDILLKLRKMRLIFGEVPFILRYDIKAGQSKMDVRRTVVNTLRLVARRRLGG